MIRDPNKDKRKADYIIKEQVARGATCMLEDCNDPISHYQGPGGDVLCRKHQRQQSDYGGYGRYEREHTFHRSDVCQCCGKDINDDERWDLAQKYFNVELNEIQKHEIKRRYNHGDHEHRKADGGNNSAENTNAYCSFCHWVKTVINNDGRKKGG